VNKGFEYSPSALIRTGDTISLPIKHWKAFYTYFRQRLRYRLYGKRLNLKRTYKRLKKKQYEFVELWNLKNECFFYNKNEYF